MFIVHVFINVKSEFIEDFKSASIENTKESLKEKGVVRFDFIQQQDDPNRFVLVEVYREANDSALHKETAHYKKWRDKVAEMMAEPRISIKYTNIFPNEKGWNSAI